MMAWLVLLLSNVIVAGGLLGYLAYCLYYKLPL